MKRISGNGACMDNNNLNEYDNGNGYNGGQNGPGKGGPGQGGPGGQNRKPSLMFILLVALFTLMMVSFLLRFFSSGNNASEITWSEFLAMVEEEKIEETPQIRIFPTGTFTAILCRIPATYFIRDMWMMKN